MYEFVCVRIEWAPHRDKLPRVAAHSPTHPRRIALRATRASLYHACAQKLVGKTSAGRDTHARHFKQQRPSCSCRLHACHPVRHGIAAPLQRPERGGGKHVCIYLFIYVKPIFSEHTLLVCGGRCLHTRSLLFSCLPQRTQKPNGPHL